MINYCISPLSTNFDISWGLKSSNFSYSFRTFDRYNLFQVSVCRPFRPNRDLNSQTEPNENEKTLFVREKDWQLIIWGFEKSWSDYLGSLKELVCLFWGLRILLKMSAPVPEVKDSPMGVCIENVFSLS